MNIVLPMTTDRHYFNSINSGSILRFSLVLKALLHKHSYEFRPLVFLCIGTDRATGDCLGPIIGHKLSLGSGCYHVYGTLYQPVHAKNLKLTIEEIYSHYSNPLIIAIDASLGKNSHIGYVTLTSGPLKPGAGVDKELPYVGDLSITGIVNMSGILDQMLLQTTRLNTVMQLADFIHAGIRTALFNKGT